MLGLFGKIQEKNSPLLVLLVVCPDLVSHQDTWKTLSYLDDTWKARKGSVEVSNEVSHEVALTCVLELG
jgi:hypothetical protein